MAKSKSTEEKIAFINENKQFVPMKQKAWFEQQDVDKQYEKIVSYIRKHKPAGNRINIKNEIKKLISLNPTPSQVNAIINSLTEWLETTTERQIAEIDKQIELLNKQKEQLQK